MIEVSRYTVRATSRVWREHPERSRAASALHAERLSHQSRASSLRLGLSTWLGAVDTPEDFLSSHRSGEGKTVDENA
jgi:hypothetical protein